MYDTPFTVIVPKLSQVGSGVVKSVAVGLRFTLVGTATYQSKPRVPPIIVLPIVVALPRVCHLLTVKFVSSTVGLEDISCGCT